MNKVEKGPEKIEPNYRPNDKQLRERKKQTNIFKLKNETAVIYYTCNNEW